MHDFIFSVNQCLFVLRSIYSFRVQKHQIIYLSSFQHESQSWGMIYTRTSCISSAVLFLQNFVISCFAYLDYKCIFHRGRIWFVLIPIWKTLTSQMKKNRLKLLSPQSLIYYSNTQKSYGRGKDGSEVENYHLSIWEKVDLSFIVHSYFCFKAWLENACLHVIARWRVSSYCFGRNCL